MPGVAQLWLTQKEIAALIAAAPNKGTTVSPAVWRELEPKLTSAQAALGCPVNLDANPFDSPGFEEVG